MTTAQRLVPDDLRGVWMRTLLQTDTSNAAGPTSDRTTWVRWMQTSLWHADLRVPESARQGRQPLPLQALSAAQRAALASQQGFAGVTQCDDLPEGQVCTWLRRMDYQPPGLQPDAGWLLFEDEHKLIEVGVHDDYNEVWERLPDSMGRFIVLAGRREDGSDNGARILIAGAYMMQVRPRTRRWPRGMTPGFTLADVLLHSPDQALEWLDCEISFGRLRGDRWEVECSTLPGREGHVHPWQACRVDDTTAQVKQPGGSAATWCILEWTSDRDTLHG